MNRKLFIILFFDILLTSILNAMDDTQNNGLSLTRERKVGFLFLLLFAILTVGLGVLQLRNTIYGPFVVRKPKTETNFVLADETTRLQQIDTDHDGINDYEELYFYETSPYIEDTDSDGIQDKAELDAGGDPLCPQGKDCSGADATLEDKVSVGTSIGSNVSTPSELIFGATPVGSTSTPPSFDLNGLIQDPAALRQIILSTGKLKKEDLDKISDADLMKLVQQIVQNQPTPVPTASVAPSVTVTSTTQ